MSDQTRATRATSSIIDEARRQVEICNACRYCEGYCSAFPAITRLRSFTDGDLSHIANLCHNCRGCYYSCQYTAPHEFDLNVPKVLAQLRGENWQNLIWPSRLGQLFQRSPWGLMLATLAGFALIFAAMRFLGPQAGSGFYALLSHSVMVAIFLPAFLLPLAAIMVGLWRYWRMVGGERIKFEHLAGAFSEAASMRNLAGGHGQGCNFEDGERFSNRRRFAHQLAMYGFLLCFLSTSIATIMHYGFGIPAPYPLISLPKLFGLSGGVMLVAGCGWLLWLKRKADASLADPERQGSDNAFTALLGFVALTGLVLYGLGGTDWTAMLLAVHLGSVLAFFVLMPYTKMTHGFFRLAALIRDQQLR